jgi:hypothetical protein
VEAVYHLHNSEGAKKRELVFLSGTPLVRDFKVRLNGEAVPSQVIPWTKEQTNRFPKSWLLSRELPGFGGDSSHVLIEPVGGPLTVAVFTINLEPGAAILSVRYHARAAGADERHLTTTWHFPYLLAPARAWGGFGTLDVTVQVPEGWESIASPALEGEGDVLRGHFEGLPADTLALAVRAPVPRRCYWWLRIAVALYVLALPGGALLCWLVGGVVGRWAAAPRWSIIPVAVAFPLFWAAALWAAFRVGGEQVLSSLKGQESPYLGERFFAPCCMTMLLTPVVVVIGGWLTWKSANRTRR